MYDLTGFQRDLLYVIAGLDEPHGLGVKEELEEYYKQQIHHGRVYPNLDTLVDKGLVEKDERDKRSHVYSVTKRGWREIKARVEWEDQLKIPERIQTEKTTVDFDDGQNNDSTGSQENHSVGDATETPEADEQPNVLKNRFFFGRDHWIPFQQFIGTADHSVKILTNNISADALETIFMHKGSNVDVQIITNRAHNYTDLYNVIGNDKLIRYKRTHGKICIVDDESILLGSSNITVGDLGGTDGRPSKINADIISMDSAVVSDCVQAFDGLWNGEFDNGVGETDSSFVSSIHGIPTELEAEFVKATDEIVIIIPQLFDQGSALLRYLRKQTPSSAKINIVTHHRISDKYVDECRHIVDEENVNLILTPDRIHAKVYVFDWETALISSVNFNIQSWCFSLETGIFSSDEDVLNEIAAHYERWEGDSIEEPTFESKESGGSDSMAQDRPPGEELPFELEGDKLKFYKKIQEQEYVNRPLNEGGVESGSMPSINDRRKSRSNDRVALQEGGYATVNPFVGNIHETFALPGEGTESTERIQSDSGVVIRDIIFLHDRKEQTLKGTVLGDLGEAKVITYDKRVGSGFVNTDLAEENLFFHRKDITDPDLNNGQNIIMFEIIHTEKNA